MRWNQREQRTRSAGFGKNFIDYYLRIKEAEIARYQSEVTEWEQREYFELFSAVKALAHGSREEKFILFP